MTDERYLNQEAAEALRSFLESARKRVYPSGWHADGEFQQPMEISATQVWANELNKQGHSICRIEPNLKDSNPNDPPDCIAEMDGERIGVEVTELTVNEKERKKYVKARGESVSTIFRAPGQVYDDKIRERSEEANQNRPKVRVPNTADWPFDKFLEKLGKIVQKKVGKMRKKGEEGALISLDKYFLLVVTGEQNLGEERLDEYLNKIKLPRPQYFDAIYVIGDYVPNGGDSGLRRVFNPDLNQYEYKEMGPNLGGGHYPVFEVCLS